MVPRELAHGSQSFSARVKLLVSWLDLGTQCSGGSAPLGNARETRLIDDSAGKPRLRNVKSIQSHSRQIQLH